MSSQKIDRWLDAGRRALSEGKLAEASSLFDRVLQAGEHPEALHLKGATLIQQGQVSEAVALIEQAAAHDARADYFCDLGTAHFILRDAARAETAYRQALALDARHVDATYNLANLLRERKQTAEALTLYSDLLEHQPQHDLAWNNCGLALLDLKQPDDARRCFAQALQLQPNNLQALLNLANLQRDTGELAAAIELYRLGLAIDPHDSDLHLNLGNTLLSAGDAVAAVASLLRAVECNPQNATAHSALIFSLDFDSQATTADHQQARRNWYTHCIAPRRITALDSYRNPDPERKLRVGYVSADLRASSAALCFGAVLLNHDRSQFDVFCYSNSLEQDGLTQQFRQHANGWRAIGGATDAEAAAMIAADAIDILVDLSGHMQGHRLGVFAYRPAPIQISAWSYAHGTGMPEMDCMFSDPIFIPGEERHLFSERIVDLPSVISYRPLGATPDVATAPCVERGYVTFACFNRVSKISATSIALWARVLQRLPNARLLLKSARHSEQAALQSILDQFVALGIDAQRIAVLPHAQWRAHMESYAQVDVALDPYPHSGGVSLIEGLLMGVPTLAIRGHTMSSRLAQTLLHSVAMDDWVAGDADTFVELACEKCADLGNLARLRSELRDRTQRSSLGDSKAYATTVEQRYRELWRERAGAMAQARAQRLEQAKQALLKWEPAAALTSLTGMLDTDDASPLHLAALARFQMHESASALDLLRRVAALAPDNVDIHVDLSTVLTDLERWAEAIAELEVALRMQPEHGIAHYNLANLYLVRNRLEEAQTHYEQAARLLPRDAKVANNIGIVCERRGQLDAARRQFDQALVLDPNFAQAHMNIGRLLVEHDQVQEGVARYEHALTLEPQLHHLRYELLAWYERQGLYDKMPALCGRSGASPVGSGDVQEVFAAITDLVKADLLKRKARPGVLEHDLLQYAARLMELGHRGKIWVLEELLRVNPASIIGYQQLGICQYHDCHYAEARATWARGIDRRDELAQRSGLVQRPIRVLDPSWYQAIGHVALLDGYIKAQKLGWVDEKQLYLLRVAGLKVPNQAYLERWSQHVRMLPADAAGSNVAAVVKETGIASAQFGHVTEPFWATKLASGKTLWHMEFAAAVQREWNAQGRAPLLTVDEHEDAYGREQLRKLGVPDDAWIVCFHVREPGFWWKWNRFHASTRDADVETYLPAMQAVVARGGWVVRMGDASMKKLPAIPGVIDYAHSPHKSERMDVYLTACCRFFVGVNSGLSFLPPTFGRPCVLTNFTPISVPFPYAADIAVPKLLRRRGSKDLIGIEEWFASGLADVQFQSRFPEDVEVIDNDAEMIREAVLEMMDEVEGKLRPTVIDEAGQLRQRFDEIVLAHDGFLGSRISARFLQRHRELL